jgi:hypothetical protein
MEAYAWLVKEVGIFFTQGMSAEQAEDVKAAINKASIRHCQKIFLHLCRQKSMVVHGHKYSQGG